MPEDTVFNKEVDLLLLSTMIKILTMGDYPDVLWPLIAKAMGGKDAGFTADEISQHFKKNVMDGELIQGEDGAKVFLAGKALIERKYELGLIDASTKHALLNKPEMTRAELDAYFLKCYSVGNEILKGKSELEDGVAEEAEDSDE